MTFPTTPILDNFNRANETPLAGSWYYVSSLSISSSQCIVTPTFDAGFALWPTVYTDCEAYLKVVAFGTSGAWIFVRTVATGPSGTWYGVNCDSTSYTIAKFISGSYSSLKSGSVTISAGDQIGLRIVGTAIEFYHEHLLIDSTTDGDIASGRIGFQFDSATGIGDDFGGGIIVNTDDSGGQPGDDDPGGSAPGPVAVGPAYLVNCHHIDASGTGAIGLRVADVAYVMNSRVTGDVGVQVETGGILRPFGLQYPSKNLVGTGAIKPLFGDRAAWDTTTYAGRHAHDISEGTYLYHANPSNPPVTQLAPITTVSTPTTLDATHYIVIVSNGSTITLPTAASIAGKQYNIIRSGTSNVLINTTGGQTISGDASLTLTAQWDSVVVVSNGSNWIRCS